MISPIFPLPAMECLLQHLHANGSTVFANVPKVELLPAIVTVTFPSLTVTSVMILLENAFTMATTYILVAANSESDLPLFPLFNPASKHDSHGFLEAFTIGKDGVPICKAGRKMNHGGSEPSKTRLKFRCPLASRKYGCSCSTPYSDSKYGRTVHLAMKDNPRLINFPPRDSEEWKLEYNARTSAEHSNKREKIDFQLESGRDTAQLRCGTAACITSSCFSIWMSGICPLNPP